MRFDALYFLPFFLLVLLLARFRPIAPFVLLGASIAFYLAAGLDDLLLIAVMIVMNYSFSLNIRHRAWVLPVAVTADLLVLGYYKYSTFVLGTFVSQDIFSSQIIIPLGISFYTFMMISYLVDLKRGTSAPFKSLPRFALFVTFFPHLVAGPIVRANEISGQIDRLFDCRKPKTPIITLGIGLCLIGLAKKIILSDSLAPLVNEHFLNAPESLQDAWTGAWLFGFQIYYDFSGYSDIALGLAYLLGFRFPINFRQPYLSRSPREFWQRWHITLSTWIRDYIYIPLGGSRVGGRARQVGVLTLVMVIMGLWHGANWTFAVWGLGWGLAIALWRFIPPAVLAVPGLSYVLTMVVAFTLWIFFRAPDIAYALDYIHTMFSPASFDMTAGIGGQIVVIVLCLSLLVLQKLEGLIYNIRGVLLSRRFNNPFVWGVLFGLCLWLMIFPKALNNPFIYFRF